MLKFSSIFFLTIVIANISAHAAPTVVATNESVGVPSNRMKFPFGIGLSFLGEPAPSLIGVNLSYNATDFSRVSVGVGGIWDGEGRGDPTFGGSIRLFLPEYSFSPFAGMGLSYFNGIWNGAHVTSLETLSFGLDWQTPTGVDLAVGYNKCFGIDFSAPMFNVSLFF